MKERRRNRQRKLKRGTLRFLQSAQISEITEFHVYNRLAQVTRNSKNKKLLHQIAGEEKAHHDFWIEWTGKSAKPNRWKIFKFYWIARILGLTFGLKLMEKGENSAQQNYNSIVNELPEARAIAQDEERHENELLQMINEEMLKYVGSIVLGLNDALVELTGALAGLSFALQNTQLIALTGGITGIAASFSMAASEYLSTKAEGRPDALKSSIYTGIAYLTTVLLLLSPYFFLENYIHCLIATLIIAIAIIFIFNFYLSVAKDLDFKKRFWEMTIISMGVAGLSFGVGVLARMWLGVEI